MKAVLAKRFQFEAAHANPEGGERAAGMHGHSYIVDLLASGAVNPDFGWVVDYADMAQYFSAVYGQLDHKCLNNLPDLETPSIPNLETWIRGRIPDQFQWFEDVHVSIVGPCRFEVTDAPAQEALGLPRRLRFWIEAAHALPNAPTGHKCGELHGHSFAIDAACSDLDALRKPLEKLYNELDHRNLNDIAGLDNPTSEHLSKWAWDFLHDEGAPSLEAVVVQETCTARCIYRGE